MVNAISKHCACQVLSCSIELTSIALSSQQLEQQLARIGFIKGIIFSIVSKGLEPAQSSRMIGCRLSRWRFMWMAQGWGMLWPQRRRRTTSFIGCASWIWQCQTCSSPRSRWASASGSSCLISCRASTRCRSAPCSPGQAMAACYVFMQQCSLIVHSEGSSLSCDIIPIPSEVNGMEDRFIMQPSVRFAHIYFAKAQIGALQIRAFVKNREGMAQQELNQSPLPFVESASQPGTATAMSLHPTQLHRRP